MKKHDNELEEFLEQAGEIRFHEMPAELKARIKAQFKAAAPRESLFRQLAAVLTFDSRGQLGAAGIRSAAIEGAEQQLVYTSEMCEVTLNMQPGDAGVQVYGQVFWVDPASEEDTFTMQIRGAHGKTWEAGVDELGEFMFEAPQAGAYDLVLTGAAFEVVFPGIVIGGEGNES